MAKVQGKSRKGENIKGNQDPGVAGSVTAGAGQQTVQNLGGVHRVETGGQGQEGKSGILPAGTGAATEGATPPEGYETWAAFREAVDKGEYKPKPAADATGQEGKDVKEGKETKGQPLSVSDPAMQAKLQPFSEEFQKTGTLTTESKAKAAKEFGVPVEMVDAYLAGVTAESGAAIAPFYTEFGGEQGYAQFEEWAAASLSDQEKVAYNDALDKAPKAALLMAKQFKSRYEAEGGGTAPRDLSKGNGGRTPSGDTYKSWAEVKVDMGKREYETDPAFRAKVEQKLGRSTPK